MNRTLTGGASLQVRVRSKIEELMDSMGWDNEKTRKEGVHEDQFVEMVLNNLKYTLLPPGTRSRHV